ncbi:MAG: hypothetical protein HY757_08160 [Nitrospirae bacterium]|nr:hypothetical protein [Nitrospirota bacterium]
MFKLIFRTVIVIVFLIFLMIGLAIWKGGEPFRYFGEGVTAVGKSIMKFGDSVDEFISGGKKLRKNYDKIKDIIISDDEDGKSRDDK